MKILSILILSANLVLAGNVHEGKTCNFSADKGTGGNQEGAKEEWNKDAKETHERFSRNRWKPGKG